MRGIKHVERTELNEVSQGLLNAAVVIKATGKKGVVQAILPDRDGAPWSLHVRVEGEDQVTVVAPDEVEKDLATAN